MLAELTDTPPEARSDETRARIFETANKLIEIEPLAKLTVRRIADAAGVSPALIIQYFGSKDKLLMQIHMLHHSKLSAALQKACDDHAGQSLLQHLEAAGDVFLDFDFDNPDLTRYIYSFAYAWNEEMEIWFNEQVAPFHSGLAQVMKSGEPSLSEDNAKTYAITFFCVYAQLMRQLLMKHATKETAMETLKPHLRIIACGIRCRDEDC